jgi:hypothetical protein
MTPKIVSDVCMYTLGAPFARASKGMKKSVLNFGLVLRVPDEGFSQNSESPRMPKQPLCGHNCEN